MKNTVTLFLPGLLSHSLPNPPAMPALSKLLSRSQCLKGANTLELALKSLFQGLARDQIPAGALSALSHGFISLKDDGYWCRIDPVECIVDHHSAYVIGNAHLQLSSEDRASLLELLSQFLQQDGINVKEIASEWFGSIPAQVDVVMNDLLEVLGKNMGALMPSGPDQTYWRRLLTECQMLLQSASVNKQRLATNKPLISSVWFWGIGKLPNSIETEFDFIYANDSIIKGLSLCANIPHAQMPAKWEPKWMTGNNVLFSDLQFYTLFKHQLTERLQPLLIYYEENWFKPLLDALITGHIDALKLICADGRVFIVKKMQLKYFWKKILPVQKFILTAVNF